MAPVLGGTQQSWCSKEARDHPSDTRPCVMDILLNILAPAWHVHTGGCMMYNSLGMCLQSSSMVRSLRQMELWTMGQLGGGRL